MRITYGQLTSLIMLTLIVQIYVFAPVFMAEHVGHHLWISLLISIATSMLLATVMFKISCFFPNDSFVDILQKLTGKHLGKCIGFLYFAYFFVLFMIHTQIIVTMFKTLFLPTTPIFATLILALLLALYCSVLGIEVLARASNMVLLLVAGILTFLIFGVMPEVELSRFQPLLPQDIDGFWYGTLIPFANYGQVILISAIFPFVNHEVEKRKARKVLLGILSSYCLTSILVIQNVSVFSSYELQKIRYPTVELNTLIQLGEFMERLELFLVTLWVGAVLLVAGIFFTTSCFTLKQVFPRKPDSALTNIVLIIMGFVAILWFIPTTSQLVEFMFGEWLYLSLIFQAVFPFIIGVSFFVRVKILKHVLN